jgi:polar amino acid transport system substrate-binding protein
LGNILSSWLAIAVLQLFCSFPSIATDTHIVIAADIWCPFNCDKKDTQQGYMVDLASKIFAAKGIKVEYRIMPWSRVLQEVMDGQIDGAIGTAKVEANGLIFPTVEQGRMRNAFWIKQDQPWRFEGISSLQKVILAYIASYSYSRDVDTYLANPEHQQKVVALHGKKALDSALGMLRAERVDAFIEDESVLRYNLQRLNLQNIINAGYVDFETQRQNLYIAFTPIKPEAKEWASILSKGTAEMRANGQLDELLKRYGLQDWRSPSSK